MNKHHNNSLKMEHYPPSHHQSHLLSAQYFEATNS